MAVSIERTDSEFVIKIPLTIDPIRLQDILEYLQFVDVVSRSEAKEEDIAYLSKETKAGWSDEIKQKLSELDEFKDVLK